MKVEVFVPGLARLPSDLQSLESPVYFTSELSLSLFTEPHLQLSLSSQSLCGLTIDSRVDTGCVYALLPSGLCGVEPYLLRCKTTVL